MNRIEHRLRCINRPRDQTKKVYYRVSREQRGCSQTGAEYNYPVVMVDGIFLNTKELFSLLT